MRRFLIAATMAGAIACGSKNPSPGTTTPANKPGSPPSPPSAPPAPPPPSGGGRNDVVRFGPSALRYAMHQVVHIDQQLPTGPQQVTYGLSAFFRVTITGPADSVGYPMTVSIDSLVPDSGTTIPLNADLGSAKGLSYVGRLTPRGEFRNPTASDSAVAQAVSPIVGSFRNFYPRLPASGATVGGTWVDTLTMNDRATGNVNVKSVTTSHAASWEERSGTRSLRVDVSSTFTIQGGGEQLGQHFDVAGNGVRTGVDYIAVDGRYLGGQSSDSTSLTITLPVQAMTIPRTQASRTTVTVLP